MKRAGEIEAPFLVLCLKLCIAVHACFPLSQPGLELESTHMGAHLADRPVTREPMKAKPNEITHISKTCQLASVEDCSYNKLYFLVKAKLPFGTPLFLT